MSIRTTITSLVVLILIAGIAAVVFTTYKSSHTTTIVDNTTEPVASTTPIIVDATSTDATSTPPAHKNIIITQNDDSKTIHMTVGDEALVKLGDMDWTLSMSKTDILERVKNLAMIKGAQGIFVAKKSGSVDLTAQGKPICNEGEMCAQYIINVTVHIVVSD